MKQYGRTINLKDHPQIIERYLEHHRAIWPEVERGLKSVGVERMLIFKLGRQLFMFMETTDAFDPERDFARYEASNPRNREWQELMASMQEPVPGAQPDEWWAEMKLVFTL
ncbi:MAG TPA: L-rhamnose mutarotase [Candidatus Binatus sp.]|uniref:L-rhamnose mutarotase n=1 Tax=Candidatus Binatus sp. TaxID=2811406 RepID=UPI002F3E4BE2